MFRKAYFSFILLVGAVITCGALAFGQTPTSGIVEMDGTHAPVAGAVVEAYRVDVKLAPLTTKTSKKGEFTFVSLMLGSDYAIAVSGPGIAPTIYPGVKAGQERLTIKVASGDGKKYTEAEVRQYLASGAMKNTSEMSEADKKAALEYEKKVAENANQRKKAEDTNKLVNTLLKEGEAAFIAKNFDLAVSKFDEGYQADPDFEGSAPIMLNNKGLALQRRGRAAFDAARTGDEATKTAAADKARADLALALTSFNKSLEILAKAPAGGGDNAVRAKNDALKGIVDTYTQYAAMSLDPSKMGEAIAALDLYLAAEPDDVKKNPVLLIWSDAMRNAGDMKNSIYGYRKYLEKTPDSPEAMAGLGLSLFNEGVSSVPENKEEMQEGLNLMQKYTEVAPVSPTDSPKLAEFKRSVKEAVDYLKNTAKLAPQKLPPPVKKRP